MIVGKVTVPCVRSCPAGLPSWLGAFAQVEHVVDDLERHADVGAVSAQGLNARFGSVPDDRAHFSRSGEQ